jgi:hypothetical protein
VGLDVYSKLQADVYADAGIIIAKASECPHDTARVKGYVATIGEDEFFAKELPDMKQFAASGGRLLIIYTPHTVRNNAALQETFGISAAEEDVVGKHIQNAYLSGGDWCPLWEGLRLVARRYFGSEFALIPAYLVPGDESQWTVTKVRSAASDKPRIVSAHRRLGSGEVLLLSSFGSYYGTRAWERGGGLFADDAYELEDNARAGRLLFRWLAGLVSVG